jgi:hypothetical protein
MKIAFVYNYDSYYKAQEIIRAEVVRKFWVYQNFQFSSKDFSWNYEDLRGFDVVVAGLGGRDLNELCGDIFKSPENKPLIVALYPGLVHEKQLESFISKSWADVVLVNSKKDYLICSKLYGSLGVNASILNSGALWCGNASSLKESKVLVKPKIVFFEQAVVPRSKDDRTSLAFGLITFAKRFPEVDLVIKLRKSLLLKQPHEAEYDLKMLILNSLHKKPDNLLFSEEAVVDEIPGSLACITVSSSAAIESILMGVPTFFINDFNDDSCNGGELFEDSNLNVLLNDFSPNLKLAVNRSWSDYIISDPQEKVESVLLSLMSVESSYKPVSLSGEVRFLLKLCLFFIKNKRDTNFKLKFNDLTSAALSHWKIFRKRYYNT